MITTPRWMVIIGCAALAACELSTTAPPQPDETSAIEFRPIFAAQGVQAAATGGGRYFIGSLDIGVAFGAVQRADGTASGQFRQALELDGQRIDFHGEVTCLTVDPVNHRAWIGGVVTRNRSEHPAFTTAIHQPGKDVWFRVVDNGEGQSDPDRTTFLGFEGAAGFDTSAAYCEAMPWPEGDARTNALVSGNLQVRSR